MDICFTSQIISKGFTGRHGRAFLVSPLPSSSLAKGSISELPNTRTERPSQRQLVTGVHTVSDVRCSFCQSMLGWKYDEAQEESQRYKVGKYILETKMICSSSAWESGFRPRSGTRSNDPASTEMAETTEDIEFDSQDEDECEDLFAGIWSRPLASKRRRARSLHNIVFGLDSA